MPTLRAVPGAKCSSGTRPKPNVPVGPVIATVRAPSGTTAKLPVGVFDTPAEAYDRYIGRYSGELATRLIALAGVAGGERALGVGCGPRGLTPPLPRRLRAAPGAGVHPPRPLPG